MSASTSHEYNDSQEINLEKEKFNPKVKIGKDIFTHRILYLIANENLFKNKSKKSISFFLKSQIKEKSLLHLPKPRENDIIIEDIRELIELILSLCILKNASNYKINVFTSLFENIENNGHLLKYQGQILYAKVNEFSNSINHEENKILQTIDNNEKIKNEIIKKEKSIKEFPSINLKQNFYQNKLGITSLNENMKYDKTNFTSFNNNILNRQNSFDENYMTLIAQKQNNSYYNYISSSNINKLFKSNYNDKNVYEHYQNNLMKNPFINSKYKKTTLDFFITKNKTLNTFSRPFLRRSNSDFNGDSINTYRFPQKKYKFFKKTFNKYNSLQITNKTKSIKNILSNNSTKYIGKTRNKITQREPKFESFRFSYFSKENKTFFESSNKDADKLSSLFYINEKHTKEKAIIDLFKKNKEQMNNIKLIQNYLIRPSILTSTSREFYSQKSEKFKTVKNIFYEFKNKLKALSYKLDDYILNKIIERFFLDIDDSFKSIGFNLLYCLKEFFFYCYVNKYLNEHYPDIEEKNILYNSDITPEQLIDILKKMNVFLKKLENENKFDLNDYVRSLKHINNAKLTSDFFQIFVFCPDYFDVSKREITKKFLLILEIDCVKNIVSIDNFINYYHLFRFGHSVKIGKKILFINKLLHLMEAKGDSLQNKIISDIEYLFKIDNRAKQAVLGKIYDKKLNFHQNLKLNEIFDSIINYFNT